MPEAGAAGATMFYAQVAARGNVVFNLKHHRPRARKAPADGSTGGAGSGDAIQDGPAGPGEPGGHGCSGGDGGGGPAGPAEPAAEGGIALGPGGEVIYDEGIMDALCEELAREEALDEDAEKFGEWAASDARETEQDMGRSKSVCAVGVGCVKVKSV